METTCQQLNSELSVQEPQMEVICQTNPEVICQTPQNNLIKESAHEELRVPLEVEMEIETCSGVKISSADDCLQIICDCVIQDASTDVIDDLYKRLSVELCRRRKKDPISTLYEWKCKNRRRSLKYSFEKTNMGWLTSLTVYDEFGKRYFSWVQKDVSMEEHEPKKLSKRLAAENMLTQLQI